MTRGCGCLGCTRDAVVVIRHPKHGRRTVCADHARSHDVVEWLVEGADIDALDQEVVR